MAERKWGWGVVEEKDRVCQTGSEAKNITAHQTNHQKSFRHSWNVKSSPTFQASSIQPIRAPLNSDQPAKALLRHAAPDTAPARPSAGSWHLYSQHGKTKLHRNLILLLVVRKESFDRFLVIWKQHKSQSCSEPPCSRWGVSLHSGKSQLLSWYSKPVAKFLLHRCLCLTWLLMKSSWGCWLKTWAQAKVPNYFHLLTFTGRNPERKFWLWGTFRQERGCGFS